MSQFSPDAFLAEPTNSTGFDPDAFLSQDSSPQVGNNWLTLYGGLDGMDSRLGPEQRDTFARLDQVSGNPKQGRAQAINQAYLQAHAPEVTHTNMELNWPTIRTAYAKQEFGILAEDVDDVALYGHISKRITEEESASEDTIGAVKEWKWKDDANGGLLTITKKVEDFWEGLNKPLIELPRAPGNLPDLPNFGMQNPALAGAVYNGLAPLLESLVSPLGIATVGVGTSLEVAAKANPLAKFALAGMTTFFTGLMGYGTYQSAKSAPAILSDPEATFQEKVTKVTELVSNAGATLLGALGTALIAFEPKKAVQIAKSMEGKTPAEAAKILTKEAEAMDAANETRAEGEPAQNPAPIYAAAKALEKLGPAEKPKTEAGQAIDQTTGKPVEQPGIVTPMENGGYFVTDAEGRLLGYAETAKEAKALSEGKTIEQPKPAPAELLSEETPEGFPATYNLTEDIPGHPKGSTVSAATLEKAGFELPKVKKVEPVAPPTAALNKEEIGQLRERFNLDQLPKPEREKWENVLTESAAENVSASAESIAADILENPRLITPKEHAGMVIRANELQNQFDDLMRSASEAIDSGFPEKATELQRVADNVMKSLDTLTEASDLGGTEIGRALSIRRMRIDRESYALAATVQRAKLVKGEALTPEQTLSLQRLTEQIADQEAKIGQLEADLALKTNEQAKDAAKSFVEEGRSTRKASTKRNAATRRASYKAELAKMGYRVNDVTSVVPMTADVARLVSKIAETYIEEGIATLPDLVSKIQKDIPSLSDQDIYNSVGRRTKEAAKQIETEAKARVKELRQQAKLTAQVNDALEGKFDKAAARKKDSAEVTDLRKRLGELRVQADRAVLDDVRLKSIHDKISEIQEQLAGDFRTPSEPKIETVESGKIVEAKRQLAELQDEMAAIDSARAEPNRTAEAELNRIAKTYSDTQAWPEKKFSAVKEAIKRQRDEPKPLAEFEAELNKLGVDSDVSGPLAEAIELERTKKQMREDLAEPKERDPEKINEDRRAALETKIAALKEQIEGDFRNIPEEGPNKIADSIDVKAMRDQVRELERLLRTEDAIYDLEEQLRTGDYKVSTPEKKILQNAALEEALVKRQQLRREVNSQIQQMQKTTLGRTLEKASAFSIAIKATADISAVLRQGLVRNTRLALTNPAKAAQINLQALKAFFSEYSADAIDLAIKRSPKQAERVRAGLELTELGASMTKTEETFRSNLAERIPGLGAVVKASERHMTTLLNMLRADAFDTIIASKPEATLAQKKGLAEWINITTGRAVRPKGGGVIPSAARALMSTNKVFFSPRYFISRFQMFTHPFMKHMNDPFLRAEMAKDWAAYVAAGTATLGLVSLAGGKVGTDPTSSDFGKIVWGDTRIDIFGGLQQPVRLSILHAMAAADQAGIIHLQKKIDPLDASRRFLSYKLSPAVTLPYELMSGKNIVGEKRDTSETLLRAVTPMILEQTYDMLDATDDPAKLLTTTALGLTGAGVNNQKPKASEAQTSPSR